MEGGSYAMWVLSAWNQIFVLIASRLPLSQRATVSVPNLGVIMTLSDPKTTTDTTPTAEVALYERYVRARR